MIKMYFDGQVTVKVGDLTLEHVDAIVNAANWTLLGGGGVDGAIHRAAGSSILAECRRIRETRYPDGLPTGKAIITTGGDLSATYIIHTVGPIYGENDGSDAELLASSYRNSLTLAAAQGLSSIAFPAISTGVYGYPKDEAARVSAMAIREWLEDPGSISDIRLVFFSLADAQLFTEHANL